MHGNTSISLLKEDGSLKILSDEFDSPTHVVNYKEGLLVSEVKRENGEQIGSKLYAYSDTGTLLYIDIDSETDNDNNIDNRRFESEDIENRLKVIEIDKDLDGEIEEED